MIYRYMFLGYYNEKDITVSDEAYYHSIIYFNNMVYVYIETREDIIPYNLVSGSLKSFPGGRKLMPMLNVFQYSPSDDEAEWRRKEPVTPVFSPSVSLCSTAPSSEGAKLRLPLTRGDVCRWQTF